MSLNRKIDTKEGLQLLSDLEKKQFEQEGYLIFPEFFNDEWNRNIIQGLEMLRVIRPTSKAIVPHPVFNQLLINESFLQIVRSLLGKDFFFHHANGRSLTPSDNGKVWHHDYDGITPWKPEEPLMIHLIAYPQGINKERGSLVILPKSHLKISERSEPNKCGLESLEGQMIISGAPGLLVVLNSAVWHSRRLNSTVLNRPYFNYSFCQFGVERPERSEYTNILHELREFLMSESSDFVNMLLQLNTLKKD